MKDFIKQLKKEGGHILNKIVTYDGNVMIYYKDYGSLATDVKTKAFKR